MSISPKATISTGSAGTAGAFGEGGLMWTADHLHWKIPDGAYVLLAILSGALILFAIVGAIENLVRWVRTKGPPRMSSFLLVIGGAVLCLIGLGVIWLGLSNYQPATAAAKSEPVTPPTSQQSSLVPPVVPMSEPQQMPTFVKVHAGGDASGIRVKGSMTGCINGFDVAG